MKIQAVKRCYGVDIQEEADSELRSELEEMAVRAAEFCRDMERISRRWEYVEDDERMSAGGIDTWMQIYDTLRLFSIYPEAVVQQQNHRVAPVGNRSEPDFRDVCFGDDADMIRQAEAGKRLDDMHYIGEFAGEQVHIFYDVDPEYGCYGGDMVCFVTDGCADEPGVAAVEVYQTFKEELVQMYGDPAGVTEPQIIDGKYLDYCADDAERLEMGYVEFVSCWELPDQNKIVTLRAKTEWHETTVHVRVADSRYTE